MIVTENQIAQMSREEKIQLMEALWVDLSRYDVEVESPDWHRSTLEESEARLAAGEERILDWGEAKRELRKRVGQSIHDRLGEIHRDFESNSNV